MKRDEIAGWIGSMEKYSGSKAASADRAFWLQAYDRGPFTVDRIGAGGAAHPEPVGQRARGHSTAAAEGTARPHVGRPVAALRARHGGEGVVSDRRADRCGARCVPGFDAGAGQRRAGDRRHDGGGVCGGDRGAAQAARSRTGRRRARAGLSGVHGKAPRRAREPRADPAPDRGAPPAAARVRWRRRPS